MAIKYTNGQISVKDEKGNINVIYPITLAENIHIVNKNGEVSTLKDLLNELGSSAYIDIDKMIMSKDVIDLTTNSRDTTYNQAAINAFIRDNNSYKNNIAKAINELIHDIELLKESVNISTENSKKALKLIEEDVVHNTGDEVVAGVKQFIDPIALGENVHVETTEHNGVTEINFTSK